MAKGRKTGGGSRKGVPNKATAAREAQIAASGLTPLDYMLSVLRDTEASPQMRMAAANSAAPYVHPKLASIEMAGKDGGPMVVKVMRFSDGGDNSQSVAAQAVSVAAVDSA